MLVILLCYGQDVCFLLDIYVVFLWLGWQCLYRHVMGFFFYGQDGCAYVRRVYVIWLCLFNMMVVFLVVFVWILC